MASVTVSVKVRRELMDLADRMVKHGIARSRSHAFNIMIEKGVRGVSKVIEEVRLWGSAYEKVEESKKMSFYCC
ncbi:MAG: hypothetical protein FGF52_06240 [Candidatus Brockarchaeota archaeon]|nr:hypothetical protein [Candidatus Brockarchaeota archaeon]